MWAVFCVAGGSWHCLSPGPTYTHKHGSRLFLMRSESHPHLPRDKGALEQPGIRSSKGGDAFCVCPVVGFIICSRSVPLRVDVRSPMPYGPSFLAGPPALEAPGSFPRSSAHGFSPELPCARCSLLQLKSCLQIYLFLICTALTFLVPVHVMMGRIYFFAPVRCPDASCVYCMYQCLGSVLSGSPFNAKSPAYARTYKYLPSIYARNLLLTVTAASFTPTSAQSKENNIFFAFQAQSSR